MPKGPVQTFAEKSQRALALRKTLGDLLSQYDNKAYRDKLLGLFLQLIAVILSSVVPILIFLKVEGSPVLAIALVFSAAVAVLTSLQPVLNLGSRWEQYRFVRSELRKKTREIDLLLAAAGTEEELDSAIQGALATLKEIEELQSSLWFIGESASESAQNDNPPGKGFIS